MAIKYFLQMKKTQLIFLKTPLTKEEKSAKKYLKGSSSLIVIKETQF